MRRWVAAARYRLATALLRSRLALVDFDWYRQRNALGRVGRRLPWLHYLWHGDRADCHPLFDVAHFTAQCVQHGLPVPARPLKAYLRQRQYWSLDPHPLFDTAFYRQQCAGEPAQAPLLHYLNSGHRSHDPHPLFARDWYLRAYPELAHNPLHCALLHYVKIGYRARVSTHPLFHAEYYARAAGISVAPDKPVVDALQHFVTTDPTAASGHPLFDLLHFRRSTGLSPALGGYTLLVREYLQAPQHWACDPHPFFDAAFYTAQRAQPAGQPPLLDYLQGGHTRHDPHPLFHTAWYLGRKKDLLVLVGQARVPLVHFVLQGARLGESPHPLFALAWYRHTYSAGRVDDSNPLVTFLQDGEARGDRPNPLFTPDWREILRADYGCDSLAAYAQRYPVTLPAVRNRISDVFAIAPLRAAQCEVPAVHTRDYFVLFTPRSGSSWLTERIAQHGVAGHPAEWFNPDLMQSAMNNFRYPCRDIVGYCQALKERHASPAGFFGAELTATHLAMLDELGAVETCFPQRRHIVHLRQDLVLQAVSLFLATESGYFHASQDANRGREVAYHEGRIRKWVEQLLLEEQQLAAYLQARPGGYYLSWYEALQADPDRVVGEILQYLGAGAAAVAPAAAGRHQKIGSDTNLAYARRFRESQASWLAGVEASRPFPPPQLTETTH